MRPNNIIRVRLTERGDRLMRVAPVALRERGSDSAERFPEDTATFVRVGRGSLTVTP